MLETSTVKNLVAAAAKLDQNLKDKDTADYTTDIIMHGLKTARTVIPVVENKCFSIRILECCVIQLTTEYSNQVVDAAYLTMFDKWLKVKEEMEEIVQEIDYNAAYESRYGWQTKDNC